MKNRLFGIPSWLRSDEEVLKVFRRHTMPFLLYIIFISLAFIPLYIFVFVISKLPGNENMPGEIIFFVLALINISTYFYIGIIYWLDKLVLTNERVIFVNWIRLTNKEISEIRLKDIKQINIKNRGIIDDFIPILNYGILEIEGASVNERIIFNYAPKPYKIKCFINKIIPYRSKFV